jgi:8-oxo-dGTP pyrophosphatase MutT (NUDIX family)
MEMNEQPPPRGGGRTEGPASAAGPSGVELPGATAEPWRVLHRQQVSRPDGVRLGEPPSWHVPPPLDEARLRAALAPVDRAALAATGPISAVLVPIVEFSGELAVLLTRRASTLSLDPGNVAFPGGRLEHGEHPLEAALREAEEEIGLRPEAVEVLGALDLVERRRDGQRVASVVGLVRGEPELSPNAGEVEAVLVVPLSALFAEGAAWAEQWDESRREMRFFSHPLVLGEDLVWGLTARILWDLLERLVGVG